MNGNAPPKPRSRSSSISSITSWSPFKKRRNSESEAPVIVQDADRKPNSGTGSRRGSFSLSRSSFSLSRSNTAEKTIVTTTMAKRQELAELSKTLTNSYGFSTPETKTGSGSASYESTTDAGAGAGAGAAGGGTAKNNHRRSGTSRPPPSFFNRPYNQRIVSITPVSSQRPSQRSFYSSPDILTHADTSDKKDERDRDEEVKKEDEETRLKPPAPRIKPTVVNTPLPPVSSPKQPDIPPMTTAAPIVPNQPWAGGMPLAMYPPDDQEFVLRTQRASARIHGITNGNGKAEAGAFVSGSPTDGVPMIHKPTVQPSGNTNSASHSTAERSGWYNRPRRLSNNSEASSTVASSAGFDRDSFDGRIRSASTSSSHTSIDAYPIGGPQSPASQVKWQTPSNVPLIMRAENAVGPGAQSFPWQKPAPIKQYRKKAQGELFAALPGEVLELILAELCKLHLGPGRNSCATCWMRDCCSVALSARKFLKYAREALYGHIHIVGHEGPAIKKRTKTTYGSRLILLRRTLRSNAQIAVIVRSLKPPALPQGVGLKEYNDLIASVIMACPNLERLIGYYPTYNHSFQRIFQALSTRPKLKEMNWILEPSPLQQQQRSRPGGPNSHWGPVDLTRQEAQGFLDFNVNWKHLTTLVVHCHLGATLSPSNLLDRTVRCLPALQNLYLSHLPHTAFNDSSLLALPPLKTLSLAHCTGVTTNGLSALATRRNSNSLQTLTLIHMNIESLPAIARLFSYLHCLDTFNIVQTVAPAIPPDEFIMLFPYLACRTLRRLHWDIPYLPTQSTPSDTILAKSISAGGFPALRYLCAPNDPEGVFQAVCQPREKVDLPGDRFRGPAHSYGHAHTNSNSSRRPSTSQAWQGFGSGHSRNSSSVSSQRSGSALGFWGSGNRSRSGSRSGSRNGNTPPPVSPLFPAPDALDMMARDNSDLHQARMAAQGRIDQAKKYPRFFIQVFDEGGTMREKYGVGAFVGMVESKVRYVLTAAEAQGATDEGGGLVTVEDMIRDDGGEALVLGSGGDGDGKKKKKDKTGERDEGEKRTREGCVGRWNTYSGNVVDKKDKERWWHQERGRWRQAVLS